ncbi:unnamed protein product, partial [Didymodactylos carnosus]
DVEPQLKTLEDLKVSVTELTLEEKLAHNITSNSYVFDFDNATVGVSTGKGGRTVAANARNFPALINHGVAMTVGYIGPCGLNLPHFHPRASGILYVVHGKFEIGFYQENSAKFITNIVKKGQATVFPKGAVHYEQNLGCEPAQFVAAYNNEDPGTLTVINSLKQVSANIVSASLGDIPDNEFEALLKRLPVNPALGVDECLIRCGLKSAGRKKSVARSVKK